MKREAQLVGFSETVEHEVALRCGEQTVVCFAHDPPKSSGGSIVLVDLQLQLADRALEPLGVDAQEPALQRMGDTFRYTMVGWLDSGLLRVGDVLFDHPDFATVWAHLGGEWIRLHVERIEAYFS